MNKAVIIGNLTKDPEAVTTQSGKTKVNFTVAVQRRTPNQQGVREADFIPCVAWNQTGEFVNKYFTKGKKIAVVGSIQTRTYDAQDGTKRYVTEVLVSEVEFVTPNENRQEAQPQAEAPVEEARPTQMVETEDDELPF